MTRIAGAALAVAVVLGSRLGAADGSYSIKPVTAAPPNELKPAFRSLLGDKSVALFDGKGAAIGQIWFRPEVPAKATPEQVKAGITYREIEETTLLGVMKLDQQYTDYRRQKIKPGVYTLRLGYQLMDGDHMGTAPYAEFCLLVPAAREESPEPMKEPKMLHERSTRSTGTSHPAVLLLFPNAKPEEQPKLQDKGNNHWVLDAKETAVVNGQKVPLGIGLVVIGHAAD